MLQAIPLKSIKVSPTNPRTTLEGIDELAASIERQGLLQPIIVRPRDGLFEIVAGHRRYAAHVSIGTPTIPAIVRDLSDADALDVQIIENLQREDLHPLDEAKGYVVLAANGLSFEDIAGRIGKSKAYVAQRMNLTELSPKCAKLFADGKMLLGVAAALARLRNHKLMDEVVKGREWILDDAAAARRETQRYMFQLKSAPFPTKDANLGNVPCPECPRRSGNATDLFGDVEDADICTDPACFDGKRAAYVDRRAAEAEKAGQVFIRAISPHAKRLFPYAGSYARGDGIVDLSATTYVDGKMVPYRKLLDKADAAPVTLVVNPHTFAIHECVDIKQAPSLRPLFAKANAVTPVNQTENAKRRETARETEFRTEVFRGLQFGHQGGLGVEDLRLVAARLMDRMDSNNMPLLATMWTVPPKEGEKRAPVYELKGLVDKAIAGMTEQQLTRLILQLAVLPDVRASTYSTAKPTALLGAAKRYDVDLDAIKKRQKDALKVKELKKRPPPKAKPEVPARDAPLSSTVKPKPKAATITKPPKIRKATGEKRKGR
jgi:ParB/RepB/Spo0J family partition protein